MRKKMQIAAAVVIITAIYLTAAVLAWIEREQADFHKCPLCNEKVK
jgi:hypothetical protein